MRTLFLLVAMTVPPAVAGEEEIVYSEPAGEKLTLDYHAPSGSGLHPAVILVHGGGFTGGTSKDQREAYYAGFLASAGFAVFSVNYRLAPAYPYPAALEDLYAAIRFVRTSAGRWNVDSAKIALVGDAAGGYLTNMSGVRRPDDAQVQAVVTLSGISDFRNQPLSENRRAFLSRLIERTGEDRARADASPAMHIRSDAPPFLLIHGDEDAIVPLSQSVHFQQALQHAGVPCDLMIIRGGPHGTETWHTIPAVRDWEAEMTAWLCRVLKHRGTIGAGIRKREPSSATPK